VLDELPRIAAAPRYSPSVNESSSVASNSRERALKRRMSAIMRRNDGRTRLRRCANSEFSEVPLYSSPLRSQRRLKLMSDGCHETPSS